MFESNLTPFILLIAYIWVIPWKGAALWKAAKNGQKGWFIALLLLNTLAVLDIIYIFIFSNTKRLERSNQSIIRS